MAPLLAPTPEERDEINRIIHGRVGVKRLQGRGSYARMKNAGRDAVVLGCTEIPLVMNDGNSPLPTSTRPGCSLARRCGAPWLRNRRLSQRSDSGWRCSHSPPAKFGSKARPHWRSAKGPLTDH